MFIGHMGVAFAAKKYSTKPSLGTLFIATQFIDLLWPVLLLLGLEQVAIDIGNTAVTPFNFISYPISHSLLAVLLWSVLVGGIYYLYRKEKNASIILGVVVLSHWILDLITHRPDLEIIPGTGMMAGFGLWNSVIGTIVVEGTIFVLGVFYYWKTTSAKNRKGEYGFWGLVVFLIITYFMNIFGPPPESVEALPLVGLSLWILVAWAYWIDRNRGIRSEPVKVNSK
jgi:hypothetical protein